jgi:hypothetical protein
MKKMKAKVLCAILVYNGETYHEGEDVEAASDTELAMLIRERCVMALPEKAPERVKTSVKIEERRK